MQNRENFRIMPAIASPDFGVMPPAAGHLRTVPADTSLMQRLRILHLNSKLDGGGTDDQCLRLAEALRLSGHELWVAGPDDQVLSAQVLELGLNLHVIPRTGHSKLKFVMSVATLIRRERIKIEHAHNGLDIWPAILAARMSGMRPGIVITRHMAKSPPSLLSRRFLLNQCGALIAVSNFTARVLREGVYEPDSSEPDRRERRPIHGDHSKIHVVYGGIDTRRFRPLDASQQRRAWGLAPEHFVFAVAGGYDQPRGKGQREFLEAAARIHWDVPQARFLIIGRGNMQSTLQSDIRQLGLAGKAWLIPHCSNMPVALNVVDCLVHPAIGTEAFGLVVCEAHACGRPVIASALDGIPEALHVGGYGSLVPPDDLGELAAAMREWARRPPPSEAQRWEIHHKIAQRLSITDTARRVLTIYQALLPVEKPAASYEPLPEAKSGMVQP